MRILWSVLLVLLLVPQWSGFERAPLLGRDTVIIVTPVALDPAHPAKVRVGKLTFLGGVELASHDPVFGGFSSLAIAGDRFTLLSDGGNIVRFRLSRTWHLSDASFAELPGGPGTGWQKEDRDSESMSVDPRSGDIWVGFETANALWRYDSTLSRVKAHVAPPVLQRWPINEGPEAMALLPSGAIVTIAETTPWDGHRGRGGVVFTGDPVHQPRRGFRFDYIPPAGYDVSDMTVLPDGRWLVLNRRFDDMAFSNVLTLVDPRGLRRGAVLVGTPIATLAAPLIHDNFEGIALTREGSATIVWLVSDDNQMWPAQRSLLLKFRLNLDQPARRASR